MLPEMHLHIILFSSSICIGDNFPVAKILVYSTHDLIRATRGVKILQKHFNQIRNDASFRRQFSGKHRSKTSC